MVNIDIAQFIRAEVIERPTSLFAQDIEKFNVELTANIEGKSVLVIGGAGTIGSAYIRSILCFRPAKVVVVDTNENGLTELVRNVRSTAGLYVPDAFITYPVSLGSPVFDKIYNFYKPFDIVANFAAHKHVRSEKDVFSVEAMIENNLVNAYKLLSLIENDKPSHFFCVSTDKAANPVNIMGASKKLMEDIVLQYAKKIKCTTARFANVAFSNGSLLDGFIQRLMKHQALSVPGDVKRYFVSPDESGEICMLACILGQTGDIYFPKLSEDQLTRFIDITEKFLSRLGYSIDTCATEDEAKEKALLLNSESKTYPVYVFTSATTGEKLYEEFYTKEETVDLTTYSSLGVVKDAAAFLSDGTNIKNCIEELQAAFAQNADKAGIVEVLKKYISNFGHVEKGITLDSKM